jgi:transcription elongation GreA/GreB family factor
MEESLATVVNEHHGKRAQDYGTDALVVTGHEAAAHGDLSDNADYRVAKERRDFVEGRIKELDDKLARAQVIETRDLAADRVVFGCTVLLGEVEADRKVKYKIVGADEADIRAGRISVNSPVAKALMEHTPELKEVHPQGAEWNLADATEGVAIPFHPGAEKLSIKEVKEYLRKKGFWLICFFFKVIS